LYIHAASNYFEVCDCKSGLRGNSVTTDITNADDDTALKELHDALARVKAQTHVVRLAMSGMEDERDIRAIMSSLDAINDDLAQAAEFLRR